MIVPLHKKGSFDDTNNYRGITLISCFAKLFTTILKNRLKKWGRNDLGGGGIGGETTRVWGTKRQRVKIEAKRLCGVGGGERLWRKRLGGAKRLVTIGVGSFTTFRIQWCYETPNICGP